VYASDAFLRETATPRYRFRARDSEIGLGE